MKTYILFYAAMALLIIGCSTSDDSNVEGENQQGVAAEYTLVTDKNGMLTGTFLNANADKVEMNSRQTGFKTMAKPTLTFEEGNVLSMYRQKADCTGNVTLFNFEKDTSDDYTVFTEIPSCNRTETAIAHTSNAIFIAYGKEIAPEQNEYFVRILNISANVPTFVDVELDQQPVDLAFANNRLFIVTFDESSGDYRLSVMKTDTFDIFHTMDLGLEVKRIFTDPKGNVIIGYPGLHTTLNSATMAFQFTHYGAEKEPNFFDSRFRQFDAVGKMYYDMPPGSNSIYPAVAAIYDFGLNLTILYAYENFLTETQRNFEYEIESTTLVGYDEKNDLLLVGYSKTGGDKKGGLLRIKLGSEPKLIDNLDLDGIPYALFIK